MHNQAKVQTNTNISGDKEVMKALKYSVVSSAFTMPKSWINQSTDRKILALSPTVLTPSKKLFKLLGNVRLKEAAEVMIWK